MMRTQAISFTGYKSPLKTMWKKGQLPTVVRSLQGEILTTKNLSVDHLKPVSKGGLTKMSNLVLETKSKNAKRGNQPIKNVVTKEMAWDYIGQFIPIKRKKIQTYIRELYQTFKELGVL